jgi:Ca2+-binding RTX toxin-like protein
VSQSHPKFKLFKESKFLRNNSLKPLLLKVEHLALSLQREVSIMVVIVGTNGADNLSDLDFLVNTNDTLLGLGGNDTLTSAKSSIFESYSPSKDRLIGGTGNDILLGDLDTLLGGKGDDALLGAVISFGGTGNDTLSEIDSPFQDENTMVGGQGNDQINGGGFNDTLLGGLGNDTINGGDLPLDGRFVFGAGADWLQGGAGDDVMSGGIEVILGTFNLSPQSDTMYGNAGNDTLTGGDGGDFLYGGTGNDWIHGGMPGDVRFEQDENDEIYGDAGDDTLTGGVLDDLLVGGTGSDRLDGAGDSQRYVLSSARSRDTLDGGQGADDYILGTRRGVYYQQRGFATLLNWDQSDRLQLAGNSDQYTLRKTQNIIGTESLDTQILYQGELIAIVQDSTQVFHSQFEFV